MPAFKKKWELKHHVTTKCKSHFFDRDTVRFFRSRLESVYPAKGGKTVFITSEQFVGSDGKAAPRTFKLRELKRCQIETVKEYNHKSDAQAAARKGCQERRRQPGGCAAQAALMPSYRCAECNMQWSSDDDTAPACPNNCATQPIPMPHGDETLPVPDPGFGPTVPAADPLDEPTPVPAPVVPPQRCCGR